MRPTPQKKKQTMYPYKCEKGGVNIKKVIIILGFVLLIGYGVFNARNLIIGPRVTILYPVAESETTENFVVVQGIAKNVVFVSVNDRPIFIDTEGNFKEKLLLNPGSNIIRLYGRDRFKQEVVEEIRVYFKQENLQEITE